MPVKVTLQCMCAAWNDCDPNPLQICKQDMAAVPLFFSLLPPFSKTTTTTITFTNVNHLAIAAM